GGARGGEEQRVSFLRQLGERRFHATLRRLERDADTPERSRALAKTGYGRLSPEERQVFLDKALAQALEGVSESERPKLFFELFRSAAARLETKDRTALPGRWLAELGARLRPRHYSDV